MRTKAAATASTCPQYAEMKIVAGLNAKNAAAANAHAFVENRRTIAKISAVSTRSIRIAGSFTHTLRMA